MAKEIEKIGNSNQNRREISKEVIKTADMRKIAHVIDVVLPGRHINDIELSADLGLVIEKMYLDSGGYVMCASEDASLQTKLAYAILAIGFGSEEMKYLAEFFSGELKVSDNGGGRYLVSEKGISIEDYGAQFGGEEPRLLWDASAERNNKK